MLSITKDLETSNGIKASRHKNFVFITPENIEESYKKLIASAPPILPSVGKYSLILSSPLKLIDDNGNSLDVDGRIIYSTGNYFIVYTEKYYKIIDGNGNTLFDNISDIDYVGGVISLRDTKNNQDLIVTSQTIIVLPINKANIVATSDNGCYFIKDASRRCYVAYNSLGELLQTGQNLDDLINYYQSKKQITKRNSSNISLYEKVLIREFQSNPELQEYNANNLLEMLAKAASLDVDFYIDLYKVKVYPTKFTHLLKMSDGKHEIWIPDTEDELKIINDFCQQRRKTPSDNKFREG